MLIEFSVSNFRSFREKQTLSMVAAPRLPKRENVVAPNIEGEQFDELLKVAAIYGPNASGKSNLVRAIGTVGRIVRAPPRPQMSAMPVSHFRFGGDPTSASRFEVHFVQDRRRFSLDLACNVSRIVEERLTEFIKGKEVVLYERLFKDGTEHYMFSTQLQGGTSLHETWRKITGPQVTFIGQAVANSEETLRQLRAPYEWLSKTLSCIDTEDMRQFTDMARDLVWANPEFGAGVADFLSDNDIPISNFRVETARLKRSALSIGLGAMPNEVNGNESDESRIPSQTILTHESALGASDFQLSEESDGTRNLIGFWLPWSVMMDAKRCRVVVIDELDSSLHPKIVENLIRKHLARDNVGQLIFTTHDTHLMDSKLMRRDQFWLTERDENGATQLRSIHEFEGRESEDIEKRYYEGRYRGLPFTRE